MSDTPRTDREAYDADNWNEVVGSDFARNLERELGERDEQQWRQIDTAPKHGETYLITHEDGVSEAVYLHSKDHGYPSPKWSAPYYGQELSYYFDQVTHWMPLPDPPKEE
jgi:hypothetical protein